jgi:hypothetical protein
LQSILISSLAIIFPMAQRQRGIQFPKYGWRRHFTVTEDFLWRSRLQRRVMGQENIKKRV